MVNTMPDTAKNRPTENTLTNGLPWHLARLPAAWRAAIDNADTQATLHPLSEFLDQRLAQHAVIYPRYPFRALDAITPDSVKIVILGQDPYHGPNQAQGLAFSVPNICPRPPSLRNILTELKQNYPDQLHGGGHELSPWAEQGVLLLNAVLTVESGLPASHANKGWETITDALLSHVARSPTPKVFMLWGAYAQRKRALLESAAGGPLLILTANHPSPLSARRPPVPFMGCGHFRTANTWLESHNVAPVNWLNL